MANMYHHQNPSPPAYGSQYAYYQYGPPPYQYQQPYQQYYQNPPLRKYGDPDVTTPERLPVKASTFVHCKTCNNQVWTQVLRKRGGMERNGLTDGLFRAVAVMVVSFDTDYEHTCPCCQHKFEIYRLVRHRGQQDPWTSNSAPRGPEIMVDGRRLEIPVPTNQPQRGMSADSALREMPNTSIRREMPNSPVRREMPNSPNRGEMPNSPIRREMPDTAPSGELHGDARTAELQNERPTVELEDKGQDEKCWEKLAAPRDAKPTDDRTFRTTSIAELPSYWPDHAP